MQLAKRMSIVDRGNDLRRGLRWVVGLTALVAMSTQCGGSRVRVPPRIDLAQLEVLGIIEFNASNEGELGAMATRRFLEAARRDQGMVRVIELGTQAAVLRQVERTQLDGDAVAAIGERFGLTTIIAGDLDITGFKPAVRFDPGAADFGVAADVDATLAVRMVEVASGASLWNRSAKASRRVGEVSVLGGQPTFNADDPERAYGELVNALVESVTRDFHVTWARR